MSRLFDPAELKFDDDGDDVGSSYGGWRRRGRGAQTAEQTSARKQRALQQRIFFVDCRTTDRDISFEVLGTSDKSYHVRFLADKREWSCTCPDYAPQGRAPRRGHRCKHIFFVLARVLHLSLDDGPTFTTIDQVEAAMVAQQVARQFVYDPTQPLPPPAERRAQRGPTSPTDSSDGDNKSSDGDSKSSDGDGKSRRVAQRPFAGEDCGICYDKFTADSSVFFCETTCGKSVHQACFQRLVDFKQEPRCPYCRADMRPQGLSLHRKTKRRRLS
jgi:hypothetical protein